MRFSHKAAGFAATVLLLAAVNGADATTITFTFDQVGTGANKINGLADGASNSSIQTYMNAVLAQYGYGSVVVAGAKASKNYDGDDHVVGPKVGSTYTSNTLGNTDGGVVHSGGKDTFLMNNTSSSDRIIMTFSGLEIYSVKFDFEIFPNAQCASVNANCPNKSSANWPDFKFEADDVLEGSWKGEKPGDAGTYTKSPAMHSGETAPQLLSNSGTIVLDDVEKLEFIDWPVAIGIDNLTIEFGRIPEPATLSLMALGLAGLGFARRRKSIAA